MSSVLNYVPVVGHVKVMVHKAAGDEELALQAYKEVTNATTYVPVLGQVQAAWVAGTTTEEERKEHPAYGSNFVARSLTRSSAATVGLAATVMTGGAAIGAAGAAASSLGIAGTTGGVTSGMIGAATAGAIGGVATSTTQHLAATAQGDLDEVPTQQDFVIGAVTGAAGGALGGTVISRTAATAGSGGAMTAVNAKIADALGVQGMKRAAVKKGISAVTAVSASTLARTNFAERMSVSIYKPGAGWYQLHVASDETVASVVERMREHVPDAKILFFGGKVLQEDSTMADNDIQEGTDLTLS